MSRNEYDRANFLLSDEIDLDDAELALRIKFGKRLIESVPAEALERLQIIQPAIGCVNQCNFCSQVAGPVTREMDVPSLRALFGSLKYAMSQFEVGQVGQDRLHKPGVIFPYLDNDIGSYPHLKEFLTGVSSIGGRTRVSTVGWSRKNSELQNMHEDINSGYIDTIDGIRFSLTPYTIGWRTDREEYIKDFGNSLRTYKPLLETKGSGRRTGCIELRFAPDVQLGGMSEREVGNYRLKQVADYSFIVSSEDAEELENSTTEIQAVAETGVELTQNGVDALILVGASDTLSVQQIHAMFANSHTASKYQFDREARSVYKKGRLYRFNNADGEYFAFNPTKDPNTGIFDAVHMYPKTESRLESGVLDATRPFLNALMELKSRLGVGMRDDIPDNMDVTYQDVLNEIKADADMFSSVSLPRSEYIQNNVTPLVMALLEALQEAEINLNEILNYGFVVDTGVIVNQGKAVSEFRGLASLQDLPLTPNEEKGYGSTSQSSVRGNTWRISPVVSGSLLSVGGGYGKKSLPIVGENVQQGVSLGVYEWNPQTFDNRSVGGKALRSILIDATDLINPLSTINPSAARADNLRPGS